MNPLRAARRRPRTAVAALLCLLAAGCGDVDVGSGRAPTGVEIYYGNASSLQTYECSAFQLTALARFEGGGDPPSDEDVTTRVTWSSSNPGVIDVSNADLETEPGSGLFYPAGYVVARTTGTAVIRADYATLSAEFSVSADPIKTLTITPALTRMAPRSTQTFKLEVVPADDTAALDLTAIAVWSVPSGAALASIAEGSTVQAVLAPVDQPFTLEAKLFTCDRNANLALQLGAVQGLQLGYEQPEDVAIPLDFTDLISVEARFEDGSAPPQDLSGQLEIEQLLGQDDESLLTVTDGALRLSGQKTGLPQQFLLRYEPLSLEASTRIAEFAELEVQTLRVDPIEATLRYPETLQINAYGVFDDGIERPLRRHVRWSTEDSDLVSVQSGNADAGEVSATGIAGIAEVLAEIDNSVTTLQAETRLTVQRR